MDLDFRTFSLPADLRAYVEHVWTGRFDPRGAPDAGQRVVPNGSVEAIVHLGDARCALPIDRRWQRSPADTLIGLQSAPYEVRFGARVEVFAISFRPAGFHVLFGVPGRDFANAHEDAGAVLGRGFVRFAERLRAAPDTAARLDETTRYLREVAGRRTAGRVTPYLVAAERRIWASGGGARVDDLALEMAVGRRQLERAFRDALGLSPKQYLRVARLNRALGWLEDGRCRSLAEVAYRAGYADQAHFTRDFKRLVGEAPSLYTAAPDAYAANALDVAAAAERARESERHADGQDVAFVQERAGAVGLG